MLLIVGTPSSSMRCLKTLSEAFLGDAEVDADPAGQSGGVQWDPDVADTGPRRHPGHVGHGEQLCGGPVEVGAARSDPDPDRDGCVRHPHQQLLHDIVGHDGAVAVDLQDECLGTLLLRPVDGLVDGVDQDRIHVAAHLQDIDPCRRVTVGRRGVAVGLRLDGGAEESEPGHQREDADR
jgi:hypothetical protein